MNKPWSPAFFASPSNLHQSNNSKSGAPRSGTYALCLSGPFFLWYPEKIDQHLVSLSLLGRFFRDLSFLQHQELRTSLRNLLQRRMADLMALIEGILTTKAFLGSTLEIDAFTKLTNSSLPQTVESKTKHPAGSSIPHATSIHFYNFACGTPLAQKCASLSMQTIPTLSVKLHMCKRVQDCPRKFLCASANSTVTVPAHQPLQVCQCKFTFEVSLVLSLSKFGHVCAPVEFARTVPYWCRHSKASPQAQFTSVMSLGRQQAAVPINCKEMKTRIPKAPQASPSHFRAQTLPAAEVL